MTAITKGHVEAIVQYEHLTRNINTTHAFLHPTLMHCGAVSVLRALERLELRVTSSTPLEVELIRTCRTLSDMRQQALLPAVY
eukprot:1901108-Amphidinium_carterae.1